MKDHFSFWEEQDFQITEFAGFLNPKQFDMFLQSCSEIRENYENQIRKSDKHFLREIDLQKESVAFYKDEFLPSLTKQDHIRTLRLIGLKDSKILLLNTKLIHFIEDFSNTLLVRHFREYRQLANNRYRHTLLQIELNKLWPDFYHFETTMDAPTKSCAKYLYDKYGKPEKTTEIFINSKVRELQKFFIHLKNKYDDLFNGFVYSTGVRSKEQIRKAFLMNMLLAPVFDIQNK